MARATRRTVAQQAVGLSWLPLTSEVRVKCGRLRWRGELQPTPLSRTYSVGLTYAVGRRAPDVRILRPQLRTDEVRELPHVYPGDELCLCYPWEWDGSQLIARTIIPWTSEWLLHFEIFASTGCWHGGGHEPVVSS